MINNQGRPIRFGLCVGSADLIGIVMDTVDEWTNATGIFLAIEVKRPEKKPTKEQEQFLALVRSMGGRAGVAYSVEDALRIAYEGR